MALSIVGLDAAYANAAQLKEQLKHLESEEEKLKLELAKINNEKQAIMRELAKFTDEEYEKNMLEMVYEQRRGNS